MIKQTRENNSNFVGVDVFAIVTVSFAISYLFYHPYYFGDELTAFFRDNAKRTFVSVYGDLNTYKPRLVFNALWAAFGSFDASRSVPMLVNALCLGGAASLLYLIARARFIASRALSLLLASTVITSRFGAMLYLDYLSGSIETLSLLLFLVALYCALGLFDGTCRRWYHLVFMTVFSILSTFTHERYIAATFVMGSFLVIRAAYASSMRRQLAVHGVAIAVLPVVLFFMAGRILDSTPISTGTSGKAVSLGMGTAVSFLGYLSNVLLDTNFGLPWFVGTLSLGASPGILLIPAMAVLFLCLWLALLRKAWRNGSINQKTILLLGIVGAMIAIASLPGPGKQESRWMFPVAAFLGLFVVSLDKGKIGQALLVSILAGNVAYYVTGSYRGIFNVQASIAAKQFGEAFQAIGLHDYPGIILNAPEPQTSWWLGGDTILGNDASSGFVFCRTNFKINKACIYPSISEGDRRFFFGFKYTPNDQGINPFIYIRRSELEAFDAIRMAPDLGSHDFVRATLTVSPPVIPTCKGSDTKTNVSVHWLVKDADHSSVTIWLVASNRTTALFAIGGTSGTADTGKWVDAPLSFVLTDSKTMEILAVASVKGAACRNP